MSHVMCYVSRVSCHMFCVMCHLSGVTCHIFFYFCWSYLVEGLLSTGHIPSSLKGLRNFAEKQTNLLIIALQKPVTLLIMKTLGCKKNYGSCADYVLNASTKCIPTYIHECWRVALIQKIITKITTFC